MNQRSHPLLMMGILLGLISCYPYKGTYYVNLAANERPTETDLIVTTTDPVQVKESKQSDPPGLVLSFAEDKVYSTEKEEQVVNKGPFQKIKYEYGREKDHKARRLERMVIEMTGDLPYKITRLGSTVIVTAQNPGPQAGEETQTEIQPAGQTQDKAPSESGYMIGPGDVLNIEVWRYPEMTREVSVNLMGEIKIAPIGRMKVMGLSKELLEDKLENVFTQYILDPIVFVTVKEYNSMKVTVLGEAKPGMYTLKNETTLLDFLAQIGGPNEKADTSHIKLIKKNGPTLFYDLNDLVGYPERSETARVSGGDTLFIPPLGFSKVYVLGEVREPKIVNLRGRMTVIDAITEAGGHTHNAVLKSVIVVRGEVGSQRGIRINLKRVLNEADVGQNIELLPGDIVYVPKTFVADLERFVGIISAPVTWYFWSLSYYK